MSCIPASNGMITVLSQVDSPMEESPVQTERKGSRSYQIFPECKMDTDSDSSSYPEDFLYRRERLPSIVVEPTELCRPCHKGCHEEEERSTPQTEGAVDGEQQEHMEESTNIRKASIGPTSQMGSRLTPPPSPTQPEAAPPCLRS